MKGATVVLDDSYLFDGNGNVTDITDQAQAGLTTRGMAYDGLDRLTIAVAPGLWGNATYGYDALDNLRKADQGTRQYRYVYDAQLRLSQITNPAGTPQITLGYDVRGNVTGKNSQTFVFDASNRLNQVTGQETYRYDGQGRQVQTTDADGKTTFWIYSQSGQVMYTSEARRSQNLAYLYLGNTRVATRAVAWGSGMETIRNQHIDALGSPVAETDTGGVVTKRNTYAPYGEAYGAASIDGTGYTGHVMDHATGLTYMQQRYYDLQIERSFSVNPVETSHVDGGNLNRYWYANNNPYKFTDSDGRFVQALWDVPVGAILDIAVQKIANPSQPINWKSVGVSAAVGAVSGGVASVVCVAAIRGTATIGQAVAATAATNAAVVQQFQQRIARSMENPLALEVWRLQQWRTVA